MMGCTKPTPDTANQVAQVGQTILYQKDLKQIIPVYTSSEDSTALANTFIEKWIREQLIIREAEANVKNDAEIDKLVNDYKSSLLKHKYEQLIISQNLDTIITPAQLKSNYSSNKSQYILTEPILKCMALSIPDNMKQIDAVQKAWEEDKIGQIPSITSNSKGVLVNAKENGWIKRSELYTIIPSSILKDETLEKNLTLELEGKSTKYFLKIYDFVDKSQEPPLEYISLQLKKVILHKRKQKILQEKIENTYEAELRKNNIKVY